MPTYYSHALTPPNYLVTDASYPVLPQYNYTPAAPYPYSTAAGSGYQQPQYYMPEVDYASRYYAKAGSPTSVRGIGSYSSNGTTFFMPTVPVDHGNFLKRQHQHQHQYAQQQAPSEEVTGGVTATLDYKVEYMAEFVSSMALTVMKTDQRSPEFRDAFNKFTLQVLTATRMPKATILLALVYLSKRWKLGHIPSTPSSVHPVYKMLVVALLLANKFNDDNTFTNTSWHEATGIPVRDLSLIESDWLRIIKWSLHLNPEERNGWDKWNASWEYFSNNKSSPYPVSRSEYPMSPPSPYTRAGPSHPGYPTSRWYDNTRESRPPSLSHSLSSMSSLESVRSARVPVHSHGQYMQYYQPSYPNNPDYGGAHRSASYYVPTHHGAAGCYCSNCTFPLPSWYKGTATAAC